MPPPGRRFGINSYFCSHGHGRGEWLRCVTCRREVGAIIGRGGGYLSLEVRKISTERGYIWPAKPRKNSPAPLTGPQIPKRGNAVRYPSDTGEFLKAISETGILKPDVT